MPIKCKDLDNQSCLFQCPITQKSAKRPINGTNKTMSKVFVVNPIEWLSKQNIQLLASSKRENDGRLGTKIPGWIETIFAKFESTF